MGEGETGPARRRRKTRNAARRPGLPGAGQQGGVARAGRPGRRLPPAGGRRPVALRPRRGPGGRRQLRELNLDKCLGITDMGLAKVAVGCPKLEKLSFKWCREISDIGVDLLVKKCRELCNLDISYLKVSNESLRLISTLEKLEELAMVGCSCIDDGGLELLSKGSNSLQSIDVSRCDHVTSQGLASLIDGQSLLQKINAADSLHKCHVKNKDIRKPLDGIHISDKGALHFLGSWQQF